MGGTAAIDNQFAVGYAVYLLRDSADILPKRKRVTFHLPVQQDGIEQVIVLSSRILQTPYWDVAGVSRQCAQEPVGWRVYGCKQPGTTVDTRLTNRDGRTT